jgi:hypothetical protein
VYQAGSSVVSLVHIHFPSCKGIRYTVVPRFPSACISIQSLESSVTENYWGKNAIELRYAACDHTVCFPNLCTDKFRLYGFNQLQGRA